MIQDRAFLLHKKPFREDELLVDMFSLQHGHIRGLWRMRKNHRKAGFFITPFCVCSAVWSADSSLKRLRHLEPEPGQHFALNDKAQLYGLYVNELIYRTLPLDLPEVAVFDQYLNTMAHLESAPAQAVCRMEMTVIDALGLSPDYHCDTSGDPVARQKYYQLADYGFAPYSGTVVDSDMVFSGEVLQAVGHDDLRQPAIVSAARRINERVLMQVLDGQKLKTRWLLKTIQNKQRKHR